MNGLDNFVFYGNDGAECEDFVRAVRQWAYSKGQQNDPLAMAQYAATCFAGSALRWHARLDPLVKNDWNALELALFDGYPTNVEDQDSQADQKEEPAPIQEGEIVEDNDERDVSNLLDAPDTKPVVSDPGPPQAPVLLLATPLASQPPQASFAGERICVVPDGTHAHKWYISRVHSTSSMCITRDPGEAVRVEVDRSGEHNKLIILNSTSRNAQWVGVSWESDQPTISFNSSDFANISFIGPGGVLCGKMFNRQNKGTTRFAVWSTNDKGFLRAHWKGFMKYHVRIGWTSSHLTPVMNLDTKVIRLVPGLDAFLDKNPGFVEAI